jgi:hypothetical protein
MASDAPAASLVGEWRATVNEFGDMLEIVYDFKKDGTTKATITSAKGGTTTTEQGWWEYADEMLYETFSDGTAGKASIRWIRSDLFELTILDNGVREYKGIKRYYRRIKPHAKRTKESRIDTGVPECEDYLAKYEICVNDRVPEAARTTFQSTVNTTRKSWKALATTPSGKAALAQACRAATDAARQSMKEYGCTF